MDDAPVGCLDRKLRVREVDASSKTIERTQEAAFCAGRDVTQRTVEHREVAEGAGVGGRM